ncbi:MAG: hypothetical protein IKM79_01885 [Bacteroidales bacterium]|nr:hypothetical protein [Bacteroidales bacterium]
MKIRPIIQIVLGIAIIGLAILLYNSIMKPMRFENEYNKRRDACAEKLKAIRTLEEAYKVTYGCYSGSFDTLINRLMTEDSMKTVVKITNYDKIPADVDINEVPESEAVQKGYVTRSEVFINPIVKLREDKKLPIIDANGHTRQLTDEEIKNLRYVPYPKEEKNEFDLQAAMLDKNGFFVPVFECKVPLTILLSDMDHQQVVNRIAEIEKVNGRYAGWKVGDMTQAVTDGNFE